MTTNQDTNNDPPAYRTNWGIIERPEPNDAIEIRAREIRARDIEVVGIGHENPQTRSLPVRDRNTTEVLEQNAERRRERQRINWLKCRSVVLGCCSLSLALMFLALLIAWPLVVFLPRDGISQTDCFTLNSTIISIVYSAFSNNGIALNVKAEWCDNEFEKCYNDSFNLTRPMDSWDGFESERMIENYRDTHFYIGSTNKCYYHTRTLDFDGYYEHDTNPVFWFVVLEITNVVIFGWCFYAIYNDRN